MFSTMDICSSPGITGPCSLLVDRWYYNVDEGKCKYFTYSGCGGNENNFQTLQLCQDTCLDVATTTFDSDDAAFINTYHIAGFILIFIVVYLFFCLYYLSRKQENKPFEPHQHIAAIQKDRNNKYNTRECLFVSNIAKKLLECDIKELFGDYGEIVSFDFQERRGDQLNICLVEFKSVDDANRAMGELNGVEIEHHLLCIQPGSQYTPNIAAVTTMQPVAVSTHNYNNNEQKVLIRIDTVENIEDVDDVDTNMNNNAKIENKNNFLNLAASNVVSPSATMSMQQVDSDFRYYTDDNCEAIHVSDSDQIDFADNKQIFALKQFVAKKLTLENEDHYNDYVGIDIEED